MSLSCYKSSPANPAGVLSDFVEIFFYQCGIYLCHRIDEECIKALFKICPVKISTGIVFQDGGILAIAAMGLLQSVVKVFCWSDFCQRHTFQALKVVIECGIVQKQAE